MVFFYGMSLLCEGGYCVFFEDLLLSFCPFVCVCCCYDSFLWMVSLFVHFCKEPGCNCWLGRWWSFFMVSLLCEGGYCVFFEDLLLPFCPFLCVCCCYVPSVFEWCRCLCISVRNPGCNCCVGRWWSFFMVLLLCEGGYCVFFEDLLLPFCPFLCVCCCYVPSVFEWCRCLCISVRKPVVTVD